MRTIILRFSLSLAVALALSGPGEAAPGAFRVDLELVLAVDVSGSIDEEEGRLQRKGYVEAFTAPEVLAAIRSGFHKRIAVIYIEWAGYEHQLTLTKWTLIHDEASARRFASALAASPTGIGPYTSISGAIEYAMPLFKKNNFEGTRQVIDISGDGPNNSGRMVTLAREEALRAGLTINGLPILNNRPSRYGNPPMPNLDLYYKNCVIGGPRAILVIAESFKSFAKAIRKKLVLEIAGAMPRDRAAATVSSLRRPAYPVRYGGRQAPAAPPPTPGFKTAGKGPPCDEGERRRQSWSSDY